jgi:predicted small integral membrane protein
VAINTSKVLVGGIAAGVVLNVIDFILYTYVVADKVMAQANAFKPGLGTMMMSGDAIKLYVVIDLVLGILLVWTYAAIRPRFGPGPSTAAAAAVLFWLLGCLAGANTLIIGMQGSGLWWTIAISSLVNLLLAAWVGAMLYKEDGGTAAA